MTQKQILFKIKGMQRDLSNSVFSKEYAFENMNIRINADTDNGLLSITNEKGTRKLEVKNFRIKTILGTAIVGKVAILFCRDAGDLDAIIKLQESENTEYEAITLYSNDLGFSLEHPIETLVDIENENIQKVYWVDGINQPRVINITGEIKDNDNTQFDFVPSISGGSINVEHSETVGQFPAGVIQYVFTYFNKFGAESAVVDVSPIYYIADKDKGVAPNETVNKSFKVSFTGLDAKWEYIRLYSIIRTSINTTPEVRKVVDLKLTDSLSYTDTGALGEYIAPTDLLYKGGEVLAASTITSKDGTLFLGDIDIKNTGIVDSSVKDIVKNLEITRSYKLVQLAQEEIPLYNGEYNSEETEGEYYQYKNSLYKPNSEITHYKANDYYRLGVQLQDKYGKWTDPIFIKDDKILEYPTTIGIDDNYNIKDSITVEEAEEIRLTTDALNPPQDGDLFFISNDGNLQGAFTSFKVSKGDLVTLTGSSNLYYNIGEVPYTLGWSYKYYLDINPDNMTVWEGEDDNTYTSATVYRANFNTTTNELNTSSFTKLLGQSARKVSTEEGYVIQIIGFPGNEIKHTFEYKDSYPTENIGFSYYWVLANEHKVEEARKTFTVFSQFHINNVPYIPGYVKIRPVVVFPEETDRECMCQGVLCPTIFNVKDRNENGPFVQSSWSFRFNPPTIVDPENDATDNTIRRKSGVWEEYEHFKNITALGDYSRNKQVYSPNGEFSISYNKNIADSGESSLLYPVFSTSESFVKDFAGRFFVDSSFVTLHSPDIEKGTLSDNNLSNSKLRIIGIVPITSSTSDVLMEGLTPNPLLLKEEYKDFKAGFNKTKIHSFNKSIYGYRHLVNGGFWRDIYFDRLKQRLPINYPIAYWNPSSRFTFTGDLGGEMLSKVRISNYSFSFNSVYCSSISDITNLSGIKSRLYDPINNGYLTLNNTKYYQGGQFDKLITEQRESLPLITPKEYKYYISIASLGGYYTDIPWSMITDGEEVILYNKDGDKQEFGNSLIIKENDTTIKIGTSSYIVTMASSSKITTSEVSYNENSIINLGDIITPLAKGEDYSYEGINVIPITYNSGKHIIIDLGDKFLGIGNRSGKPFWEKEDKTWEGVSLEGIDTKYGYAYLGELYQEVDNNSRFGGTSDYAIQNNLWLPAGNAVTIGLPITWTEGDTYYQRYDHIKTMPRNDQDLNGVTSVISFMCETRINLDGRYDDRYKAVEDGLAIAPEKFNQLNEVYSQSNNFFNYRVLDTERFGINKFPNTIVWSKTKYANNIVDNWLNINLASSLDLDGNKGKVTALKVFNDNIISFQEKGISQILFNSRVQINTSDSVPIEIANSGKVDGKRYLGNNVGCFNKYSICSSPNGLYFIDDYNKSIYLFNGEFSNLSETKGFHSWMVNNSSLNVWTPEEFNNAVTYRDPINNEVLFIYKDKCLAFNELLGEFSSFYSYEDTPYMFTLNDKNIMYHNGNEYLWVKNEGEYNNFFEDYKNFYTTVIANDNPTYDKIFSTLDFRADVLNDNNKMINSTPTAPFNYLKVVNEYQEVESNLSGKSLIPKFRVWRAQFPRLGKNRIRNTWATITLGNLVRNRKGINKKVRLHDMVVNYFI